MPKTENFQWYVEQVADGELHSHALSKTLAQGRSKYQSYAIVESPQATLKPSPCPIVMARSMRRRSLRGSD